MPKEDKAPQAPQELDQFAPIEELRLTTEGVRINAVTTIFDTKAKHRRGTISPAKKIEWHPMGARVWLYSGAVFVIPADRIETFVQVPFAGGRGRE